VTRLLRLSRGDPFSMRLLYPFRSPCSIGRALIGVSLLVLQGGDAASVGCWLLAVRYWWLECRLFAWAFRITDGRSLVTSGTRRP
jgi:hypothetical protein